MPHIAVNLPSGPTVLALLPLALLILGLVVYTLIQLARAEHAPYLPKWLWAALIVLSTPWGAIAYLLLSRFAAPEPAASTAPSPAPDLGGPDTDRGAVHVGPDRQHGGVLQWRPARSRRHGRGRWLTARRSSPVCPRREPTLSFWCPPGG